MHQIIEEVQNCHLRSVYELGGNNYSRDEQCNDHVFYYILLSKGYHTTEFSLEIN